MDPSLAQESSLQTLESARISWVTVGKSLNLCEPRSPLTQGHKQYLHHKVVVRITRDDACKVLKLDE